MRFDDSAYPDDWVYFDNSNAPSPSATAATARPAPSPQPNPGFLNRPAVRPDPFQAFWSRIPATSLTHFAWDPPVFPDSFGRHPFAAPAPLHLPPFPQL